MLFKTKQKTEVDIIDMLGLQQSDADRIMGGLMRVEGRYRLPKKCLEESLKLAKNEKEKNLVWYAIGLKMGIWSEKGFVIPNHIYKKLKKEGKNIKPPDPAVQ